jgi:hypothetical protein
MSSLSGVINQGLPEPGFLVAMSSLLSSFYLLMMWLIVTLSHLIRTAIALKLNPASFQAIILASSEDLGVKTFWLGPSAPFGKIGQFTDFDKSPMLLQWLCRQMSKF